ncbi:YraN family protein [Hydrogenophaga sp.]|uniref:YraN family protein n=1 Tax=Hydrogenophaga sp. TaxID=1904254 RepID=UPI003F71D014
MWSSRKPGSWLPSKPESTTKARGDAAEDAALVHLRRHGLALVQRNFRTPGRGGGEVDLIMREPDGTLVFVEVRQRVSASRGGAGASITAVKQRRIVFAARHFLLRLGSEPPCRFDVVLLEGERIEWLRAAFDASGAF